jgi:hypothetical protein
MKNLELWDINVSLEDKFSEADTGHIRIKYVNDMIFNEYNYSTDGRSQVMEYDAKVIPVAIFYFVFYSLMYSIDCCFTIFSTGV